MPPQLWSDRNAISVGRQKVAQVYKATWDEMKMLKFNWEDLGNLVVSKYFMFSPLYHKCGASSFFFALAADTDIEDGEDEAGANPQVCEFECWVLLSIVLSCNQRHVLIPNASTGRLFKPERTVALSGHKSKNKIVICTSRYSRLDPTFYPGFSERERDNT